MDLRADAYTEYALLPERKFNFSSSVSQSYIGVKTMACHLRSAGLITPGTIDHSSLLGYCQDRLRLVDYRFNDYQHEAIMANLYSLPPLPPNFDALGIFYVVFCAIWTTLVTGGMVFLWTNRRYPLLKIRGLPLSFVAIVLLHAYWVLGQFIYPVGQTIPIVLVYDFQYFFMGLWYPLGIALFHASNSRFLYIAMLQKQFACPDLQRKPVHNGVATSWLCRLRNIAYPTRVLIYIGFGMVVQVNMTTP
jgi:hypothetical protein